MSILKSCLSLPATSKATYTTVDLPFIPLQIEQGRSSSEQGQQNFVLPVVQMPMWSTNLRIPVKSSPGLTQFLGSFGKSELTAQWKDVEC